MRNQGASIYNLENQLGKISKILTERAPGFLLGNTKTNPKEHVKVVTLRSRKKLQIPEEDLQKKK